MKRCCFALLSLAALALLSGCATGDVNPSKAHSNTGYVDFHADPSDDLFWEISRYDPQAQNFHRVYSELEAPPSDVLRLAFRPGQYRFRVTFLNQFVNNPAEVEVQVQDGRITPVRVTLSAGSTTTVQTKETTTGGTVYGRAGRRTKITSSEAREYDLSAAADSPVSYQPKEQMSYAHANPEP
jgi:hypothetical protein